jgi:hypothetical protein
MGWSLQALEEVLDAAICGDQVNEDFDDAYVESACLAEPTCGKSNKKSSKRKQHGFRGGKSDKRARLD